jgi:hypothetical protein
MDKSFTDKKYAHIIDKIMAMDLLASSFNDEVWILPWSLKGVPDGLESREDYENRFPNDEDLVRKYDELTALFCRLIARQTASISIVNCTTAGLKFNGDKVII